MPIEITIPRLGWSMDEGTFGEWLKQDGEFVDAGDAIFTMESEKALQEVESIDAGILRLTADSPNEGDTVTVGQLVGFLLEEGEETPVMQDDADSSNNQQASELSDGAAVSIVAPTAPTAPVSLAAKRPDARSGRTKISPRAARLAKSLGVDPSTINGTGKTGRIRERDVQVAAEITTVQPQTMTPRRRTIATRMLDSSTNTAAVTLTTRVDATNLVSLRHQFKASQSEVVPSYQDIIIKLTSEALRLHPVMNSHWTEDGPLLIEDVHVGFAVDTDEGLLVPVIQNVDRLGLLEIASRSRNLVDVAQRGKLSMPMMSGGTFSVTSLGAQGIDAFTPIINTPQTAILGIGAIRRVAAVFDDDRIAAADQLTLSLTFDNRAIDGAPAARFLKSVAKGIQNPSAWLIK